jgi:hypothetical protein
MSSQEKIYIFISLQKCFHGKQYASKHGISCFEILEDWLSQKGPCQRIQNPHSFFCLVKNFNEAEHSKNVFYTKVKVFQKKVKDQKVSVMISNERSCQKEYTCEIWKPYQLPIKSYDQG